MLILGKSVQNSLTVQCVLLAYVDILSRVHFLLNVIVGFEWFLPVNLVILLLSLSVRNSCYCICDRLFSLLGRMIEAWSGLMMTCGRLVSTPIHILFGSVFGLLAKTGDHIGIATFCRAFIISEEGKTIQMGAVLWYSTMYSR